MRSISSIHPLCGQLAAILFLFFGLSLAAPSSPKNVVRQDTNATAPAAAAAPLRVLVAGASVSFGVGSKEGDSYRKPLRQLLVDAGNEVNFVGTRKNGNFTDNQVEATSGFVLNQIEASLDTAVPKFLPNLVLLETGTNNCNKGGIVADMGTNVTRVINKIFANSPNSTVVMCTPLVNSVAKQDACRQNEVTQYQALAANFTQQGAKLVLVDMRSSDGPTLSELADGRHPNDVGYAKMANVWFAGIQNATGQGFITAPADNGIAADGNAANA